LYARSAAPRHKVIDNNLNIKEVTLDDGGLYVCRATQSNPMIADFREMNITLKIQRKFIPYSLFFAGSRRRRRSLSSRIDFCACVSFIFIYLFIYLKKKFQMSHVGSKITQKKLTVLLVALST
jgi:hypothetical protein